MPPSKPYRSIPIRECGEPMVALTREDFALIEPHPYVALGAPYGGASPWMLRRSVAKSLRLAQKALQSIKPGWKILLTDAYRPNTVQAFMVEREFTAQAVAAGLNPYALSASDREMLGEKVFRAWGIPSDDPATPPPHSTGAVFDCTLIDERGREVYMGSPVDENSDRSMPDYFAHAADEAGKQAHAHRVLLNDVMRAQGLIRNSTEWWHFSRGDQLAVWVEQGNRSQAFAIYGRATKLAYDVREDKGCGALRE